MEILRFLREPGNIDRLREGFQHVTTLTEEGRKKLVATVFRDLESDNPTYRRPEVDIYTPPEVVTQKLISLNFPSLSHDGTGAGILKIIAEATAEKYVPIWLRLDLVNWVGCQWTYVIDLDQNMFEVFGKSSETKQEASTTRFNDVGEDNSLVPALLKGFSFSQLPATEKEFMRALKAAMKEKGMYKSFLEKYTNIAADSDDESSEDEICRRRSGMENTSAVIEADK
jgi:hypothetical protein